MLDMILKYIPILGIAIFCNLILGMYNNIGLQSQKFNFKKMITGIIKAVTVASSFIGLAYCFDVTGIIMDIGTFELTPELIMISSITLYMVKDTVALANILGVKKSNIDLNQNNSLKQSDPLERR